jgi:LacI family transcriptional regulator
MKDIARDLGLSVVTVSKVFRGHPDISEETRTRVLDRMAELNYQPNLAARSLATGRSFTVGFIAPDLVHPFFAEEVAQHLAGALRASGYHLLMSSSREEPRVEQEEIEHLLARRVDVLIVASTQGNSTSLASVVERKVPLILIDRQFSDFRAHFVGVDDERTGRMATQHLLSQGCRVIGYIGSWHASTSTGRLAGYRAALKAAGLTADSKYVISRAHGDHLGDKTGFAAMKELLAQTPRPDGVFCNNDPTAMGAMQAVLEQGLRVPEDVAIVGCGNVSYSSFLRVPLTSVDQDCAGLGQGAAKLALELLTKPTKRSLSILLDPKLIIRESSLRRNP